MSSDWSSLRATDMAFTSQMSLAQNKCEVCPARIGEKCGAHASEVVQYTGADHRLHLAATCTDCRRRFFGKNAAEKRADTMAFKAKQALAFDIGPPGEPWKPRAAR